MGMIDKGILEICLVQSNGIKTFLSNCGIHRQTCRFKYDQCSKSLRRKVEADVLYTCNLAPVQIYSIDEHPASLKL